MLAPPDRSKPGPAVQVQGHIVARPHLERNVRPPSRPASLQEELQEELPHPARPEFRADRDVVDLHFLVDDPDAGEGDDRGLLPGLRHEQAGIRVLLELVTERRFAPGGRKRDVFDFQHPRNVLHGHAGDEEGLEPLPPLPELGDHRFTTSASEGRTYFGRAPPRTYGEPGSRVRLPQRANVAASIGQGSITSISRPVSRTARSSAADPSPTTRAPVGSARSRSSGL